MAAAGTLVHVTSHRGGPAALDGGKHLQVQPAKPGGRVVCEIVDCGGYDVGQLKERPVHLLAVSRFRGCIESERVERAGGGFKVALRQMEVTAGGLQIAMAEQ